MQRRTFCNNGRDWREAARDTSGVADWLTYARNHQNNNIGPWIIILVIKLAFDRSFSRKLNYHRLIKDKIWTTFGTFAGVHKGSIIYSSFQYFSSFHFKLDHKLPAIQHLYYNGAATSKDVTLSMTVEDTSDLLIAPVSKIQASKKAKANIYYY